MFRQSNKGGKPISESAGRARFIFGGATMLHKDDHGKEPRSKFQATGAIIHVLPG